MNHVQVKDKYFKIFLTEEQIKQRVAEVAAQISRDLEGQKPLLLAVLNGSFMFAADLIRGIDTPCEISFVRMASYVGTKSTGHVKELIGLNEDIEGRTVVVVEDIIDSGLTMKELLGILAEKHPKEVRVASLLVKPGNLKVSLDVPYCCFEIPNDFIVGYGLDNDGEGRNLKHIYTIDEYRVRHRRITQATRVAHLPARRTPFRGLRHSLNTYRTYINQHTPHEEHRYLRCPRLGQRHPKRPARR